MSEQLTAEEMNPETEAVSDGVVDSTVISSPSTREKEKGKQFPTRNILNPEPVVSRPKKPSNEVLDGRVDGPKESKKGDKDKEVVLVTQYLKCYIGKVWYEFSPNQRYAVTPEVKERLRNRGALGVA